MPSSRETNILSKKSLRIHCVGIKGMGLSALAQILKAQGHRVSGSDVADPFPADAALRRAGIRVYQKFDAEHVVKSLDFIIASNAYLPQEWGNPKPNVEIREAKRKDIPVVSYPEVVAEIFNPSTTLPDTPVGPGEANATKGIAVAGSHGKSTTTALLAVTLENLGYNPTAIVGALVKNWESNARVPRKSGGGEDVFILEADEYRKAFLNYHPYGAILTSVDWDHPDIFPTKRSYEAAFRKFIQRIPKEGFLIVCGDEPETLHVSKEAKTKQVLRYGFRTRNALHIREFHQTSKGISIDLVLRGKSLGTFHTQLLGRHNALNMAAVVGACLELGARPEAIRQALRRFEGTARRFDILSRKPYRDRSVVIDDYAHHPTELQAVITTARSYFPRRRIRVLFQPHTFTRTAAYFKDFVDVLKNADDVALLKTYGSAREQAPSSTKATTGKSRKTSRVLAEALDARYFATHQQAYAYYRISLRKRDVLLVLGAGDGNLLAAKLARSAL